MYLENIGERKGKKKEIWGKIERKKRRGKT